MTRTTVGILMASAILVMSCDDQAVPTQPTSSQPTVGVAPTPTPDPSLAPVVTRAEPTNLFYPGFGGWYIYGSHFVPDPIATFESGASVITLSVELSTFEGEVMGGVLPRGTAPGNYTPCVTTPNGKGCGSFQVTVP